MCGSSHQWSVLGCRMSTLRSTAQLGPTDSSGVVPYPLSQAPGAQGNQMTGWYTIRRVGPLDLKAGDEVDVRAYEQIDNESSARAGDPWKEWVVRDAWLEWKDRKPRLKKVREQVDVDPRRTLPVMIELGVWRDETMVIKNQGENADNEIHHWTWARCDTDLVKQDVPEAHYETRVRFGWSAQYWYSGARMEVLDRGMLSARVL